MPPGDFLPAHNYTNRIKAVPFCVLLTCIVKERRTLFSDAFGK
jgi:hypothetical protein